MKKYYVYIHLNPTNNEIFYVGKGTGERKNSRNRNQNWLEYVSKLEKPHKILVLKDNLTEKESIELEEKVLKKIDIHFNDLTINIDKSEQNLGIKFEYIIDSSKTEYKPRFENFTDSQIIESLLSFPSEKVFVNIANDFEKIYDLFYDNFDEIEEIDEDIFMDLESTIDSITDLIEEYKVSENESLDDFISDLKRERYDVEIIKEENPKKLQKKIVSNLFEWIDNLI